MRRVSRLRPMRPMLRQTSLQLLAPTASQNGAIRRAGCAIRQATELGRSEPKEPQEHIQKLDARPNQMQHMQRGAD